MEKIGFGSQPDLVYQHIEAGHPYIHNVTLEIRADGSRIEMNNIDHLQSERARKEIENEFGLVQAQSKEARYYVIKSTFNAKLRYGKPESKRAIQNVLDAILIPTGHITCRVERRAATIQYAG